MKRSRHGFTLIEVVLFLGLTAALFAGIVVGTQASIYQQRYNDGVQNFAEFMRSVYSQVSNVQNEQTGRSQYAIYGKVVTFGVDADGRNKIRSYNLIGDAVEMTTTMGNGEETQRNDTITSCGGSSVLNKLACLEANVIVEKSVASAGGATATIYQPVGFVEDYLNRWDAQIQTTDGWDADMGSYQPYEGIVLVVRGTSSGSIYTFVLQGSDTSDPGDATKVREIIDRIEMCENGGTCGINGNGNPFLEDTGSVINGQTQWRHVFDYFTSEQIDFCVNPNGQERTGTKRDIRIAAGNKNASGVEVIDDDDSSLCSI